MNSNQRRMKMAILLKTTDVYRVENEEEAVNMINTFKDNQVSGGYLLTKSGYVLKNKKSKGEIVDSWAIVTVEKSFDE